MPHIAVVGAGAFGGWSALHLRRSGAQVTLVDAWGPGNARASSGGENRIIRAIYPDRVYVEMTVRSLQLWEENGKRWNRNLLRRTGFLRMVSKDDPLGRAVAPLLREAGVPHEELTPAEAGRRFPQINFQGIDRIFHEKTAGYLLARRGCETVMAAVVGEGGVYRQVAATPGPLKGGQMQGLALSDGSTLVADQYLFACGPWLGRLFPEVIGNRISPQRKEVYFFGVPAGDVSFRDDRFPCWGDNVEHYYGCPDIEWRGFKIGEDTRTVPFDPNSGDRTPTPEVLRTARQFLAYRFPALKAAPLLETRVCQYENTPDKHLILDRHPGAGNAWLAGGGSGHGYKLGAAVGERVAQMVLGKRGVDPFFALARPALQGL